MDRTSPLIIKETKEDFSFWLSREFISDEIRETIKNASILLLPSIGQRRENEATFPSGTEVIYSYFKEKIGSEFYIDICISDEFYQELALHSNYRRLGKFIVKSVALPVFLAVLSSYIYDTVIKPEKESPQIYIEDSNKESPKKHLETPEVKFSITVVDSNNVAKEFDYEGPADQVDQVSETIKKFWENE